MNTSSLDLAGVRAGILLIPAALGALGWLAVKLWRGMRRVVRLSDAIMQILPRLDDLDKQIKAVDKELHPNGGSSMRDQIVRVEAEVSAVKQMTAEAKEKAADAASEAEGLSGAVARFHHDARARGDVAARERRGVQESLDVLLGSLAEHAESGYHTKVAIVDAFREVGIDLGHILTAELEVEGPGGDR